MIRTAIFNKNIILKIYHLFIANFITALACNFAKEHSYNEKTEKGSKYMEKPTYYVFVKDFNSLEMAIERKSKMESYGFRVVMIQDGKNDNLQESILEVAKSHLSTSIH